MDLVKAALDAAIAAERQAAADYNLKTAQHRLEQHRALEQEAAKWGLGPIPIGKLRCFHDEPNPSSYYWWAHEINEHFVLIVRVTTASPTGTETRVLTKTELARTQQGHEGSSPDNGLRAYNLADIGRRIRNHPSYREQS